nr:transposase, MuDR, MULE transposase domain protein [Ipomoea batatas]
MVLEICSGDNATPEPVTVVLGVGRSKRWSRHFYDPLAPIPPPGRSRKSNEASRKIPAAKGELPEEIIVAKLGDTQSPLSYSMLSKSGDLSMVNICSDPKLARSICGVFPSLPMQLCYDWRDQSSFGSYSSWSGLSLKMRCEVERPTRRIIETQDFTLVARLDIYLYKATTIHVRCRAMKIHSHGNYAKPVSHHPQALKTREIDRLLRGLVVRLDTSKGSIGRIGRCKVLVVPETIIGIDVGIPPKYVGGSVKWISDLDYDEWGIITLWEKVEQFGYKRDEYRCFAKTDNGLIELVLDLEVWNLVNSVVRPKVVEIWVIVRVDGEDDSAENDTVGDDSEEYESAKTENESVDEELENFEGSDCSIEARQVDDQDFLKYTDPEVEYTGDAKLVEAGHNQHRRNMAAQAEIPAAEGEVQGNVPIVEGDIQVNVATAEEGIVQDFVAATVDSDVQIN